MQSVIIVNNKKSRGIAAILTIFFGPFGMFYSTITGGIIMTIIHIPIFILMFLGIGLFIYLITWPICVIWAILAAENTNQKELKKLTSEAKDQSIYHKPADYLSIQEKARLYDEKYGNK